MIIMALFVNIVFLGSALTIMLVYVWSRRNPYVRMNFFGLLNFQAPYLPWVLFAFSLLLGNSVIVDLMGIIVGHIYYFLEDIFPREHGGFKILKTPRFLYVSRERERVKVNDLFCILIDIGYSMKFDVQTMKMIQVQIRPMMFHLVLEVFIGSDNFLVTNFYFHLYMFDEQSEEEEIKSISITNLINDDDDHHCVDLSSFDEITTGGVPPSCSLSN